MSINDIPSIQARTLWIGEIENWMDEAYLENRLSHYNITAKTIKIIRDRSKGITLGYGFIEFFSTEQAGQVLNDLNGKGILEKNKTFKLNWASDSASKAACMGSLPSKSHHITFVENEYTIYVGELEPSVTEDILMEVFNKYYQSILGTKVVIDQITKKSKGYGFVRFSDFNESQRALYEMNGKTINGRNIKVNQASFKKLMEMGNNSNSTNTTAIHNTNSNPTGNQSSKSLNTKYPHIELSQQSQQSHHQSSNNINTFSAIAYYHNSNSELYQKENQSPYIQNNNLTKTSRKDPYHNNNNNNNTTYPTNNTSSIEQQQYYPNQLNYYNQQQETFNDNNNNQFIPHKVLMHNNNSQQNQTIVDNLNNFYTENNPSCNDSEQSKNTLSNDGKYNLFDFYSNHSKYFGYINPFNYYFPNNRMNQHQNDDS